MDMGSFISGVRYIHVLCDILKFVHDFSCMQVILLHKNVQYHESSEE